ncbi:ExbD/TolR family protein [Croceicoccus gelatinilyticus]|uniref:ExbD/TolR family protein n=1 Tax=Croceicoccus gelatinilyticus TaxID=2835536 RepID=UPI001BD0617F|nr:biopolymer transporter ExbD [Croceicoccus gelatinilyticus]MBS7668559.1 biopolymer transporter ExbD [Croceicoccus gelatinilyticus]
MAEINVTPMVDVMLVLLIIFMVAAPLLVAGVPVDLPDSQAEALDNQDQTLTVSLDEQGLIYIDEQRIPAGAFAERLAVISPTGQGAPPVVLRADKALDYGRVVAVMGALNRAGFRQISLVTHGSDASP